MNSRHPGGAKSPQAQAAKLLRMAIDGNDSGSQARFAARIGISAQRWNNVERGYPISRSLSNLLVQRIPGLSRDWLETQETRGLSVELWGKLEQVARDSSTENASTGR